MSDQGDQGAPLACPSFGTGKYLLVGALSGGIECGVEGIPDVFSSYIGPVQEWAHEIILERFGRLEEPLPTAADKSEADVGTTAGSFYYDDGKCHGYEYKHIEVSAVST